MANVVKENNVIFLADLWPSSKLKLTPRVLPLNKDIHKINERYISVELWSKKSTLACWNCDRYFDGVPCFIPVTPIRVGGIDQWNTTGNFCSWNCVICHIDLYCNSAQRWDIKRYVLKIAKQFNDRIVFIQSAPSKFSMKKYIGDLGISQDDYQILIDNMNSTK